MEVAEHDGRTLPGRQQAQLGPQRVAGGQLVDAVGHADIGSTSTGRSWKERRRRHEMAVVTIVRRAYASALVTSRSRGHATYVLTNVSWSRSWASWWSPTIRYAVWNSEPDRAITRSEYAATSRRCPSAIAPPRIG